MARIIAIANVKGGVGKTTTTLNLAAALVERTCRVLVVDLDPQASLTLSVGLDPDSLSRTVKDSLEPGASPLYTAIVGTSEKFDLVPSNHELRATERKLDTEPKSLFNLQQALDPISTRYDYILLDCPANAGVLTGLALTAAQQVIVPLTTDYLALQAFGWLWNIVKEMQRHVNPQLVVSGILLNMYDPRTRNAREITASIQSLYGSEVLVFPTTVHSSVRLKEAPLSHSSILRYAPQSSAAAAFRALALEVEQGPAKVGGNELYLTLNGARQALALHNTREAYSAFRRATDIDPAAKEAWLGRAETTPDGDEKIRCLDQAARLDSSDNRLRTQLAQELNEWALKCRQPDAPKMFALGNYFEANGELKYAELLMRRAYQLVPGREAILGLARTTEQSREGVVLIRSYLDKNPLDVQAQQALQQAEKRVRNDSMSLMNLAIEVAHAGDKTQAAGLFERATDLDPTNDRAWVGRAQTAVNWHSAFQYVKRALEINPENEEARRLYRLTWVPEEKGHKHRILRVILIGISLFVVIVTLTVVVRLMIPA